MYLENFKKIADAFDLNYYKIFDYKKIELDFKKIKVNGYKILQLKNAFLLDTLKEHSILTLD